VTVDDLRRIVADGPTTGRDSVMLKVYRESPPTGERVKRVTGAHPHLFGGTR
jgi:hypothetical protein